MRHPTEGERIAQLVCIGLPPEFGKGVAREIDTAIAEAVERETKRKDDALFDISNYPTPPEGRNSDWEKVRNRAREALSRKK